MKKVMIYTDGACRGNPGPGGWGALLRYNQHERQLYGAEFHTTNNRMELLGAICALAELKGPCQIELTTDSEYVRNGITKWIVQWKQKDWRNSGNKLIKNLDLWQRLDEEVKRHSIIWHWVRGHSGHPENEIADRLANRAIDELLNKQK